MSDTNPEVDRPQRRAAWENGALRIARTSGRARKPTEKLAKAAIVPAVGENFGKNNGPKTVAAAVP